MTIVKKFIDQSYTQSKMNSNKVKTSLPDNYSPLEDEIYMSPNMICYFKKQLKNILKVILEKESELSHNLMKEPNKHPDQLDQGVEEELRIQDSMLQEYEEVRRQEIEESLKRIDNGTYGYCAETGVPIGVKRLLTVPTAKYTVEIQQALENG